MGGWHPLVVDMVASLDRYLTHGSAGCLEITMIAWQFAPHGTLLPPSDSDLTTCRTTLISTSLTTNPTPALKFLLLATAIAFTCRGHDP